ncbi:MAG TPA: hypothetical protein VIV40_21580 [Kofleriaceae bacterium]
MALRKLLGCLPLAALAVCAGMACNKTNKDAATSGLDQRCEQLGRLCGDKDKHDEKIIDGCKLAAKKQLDKGCADKVSAVYDCYEKELCGKEDKVWALDDLRVLADRYKKCEAERKAANDCVGK